MFGTREDYLLQSTILLLLSVVSRHISSHMLLLQAARGKIKNAWHEGEKLRKLFHVDHGY